MLQVIKQKTTIYIIYGMRSLDYHEDLTLDDRTVSVYGYKKY